MATATMFGENLAAQFQLYFKPVGALSRILDRGKLWFAVLAALGVSFLLRAPVAMLGKFSALGTIVVAVVPVIVLCRALSGFGSFGVLMRTDYLSLLICLLMCWTVAFLPSAALQLVTGGTGPIAYILYGVGSLYFIVLAGLSVRTVFGTGFGAAVGMTLAGLAGGVAGILLFGALGGGLYYLMSPLFLYYAYAMLGSDVRSLGEGLRSRQHLQQQLEISTNNPRDADAHYQLGLIYQKRRQYSEAIARFQRAVEIDPSEADPHYQLGRIALEQGRFEYAIQHLKTAATIDDKLALSDVWRELGAAYLGASHLHEAQAALAKYADRRPYDPEGLYWYGKTLAKLDQHGDARALFERSVEAARTMPPNRRAHVRKWGSLSRTELKALRHHEK